MLVIFELVEAGAGRRQQHDLSGLRRVPARFTASSSVPALTMGTAPSICVSIFSAAAPMV